MRFQSRLKQQANVDDRPHVVTCQTNGMDGELELVRRAAAKLPAPLAST